MEFIGGTIIVIAVCIGIVADIMIIIRAFKTSLLWGFGTLIPLVELIFIIMYWDKTKKYVLWVLLSIVLLIVGGTITSLSR